MINIFNKIVKFSICGLVFLIPLFFLPFSFEAFEFNKQYLLFFLSTIGFVAWFGKMILIDKEIRFKRTPLDLWILGFIFIAILSAIFSVDKTSSVFGFYGRFSVNLIGLICFGIFYFLITNNVEIISQKIKDKKEKLKFKFLELKKQNKEKRKASIDKKLSTIKSELSLVDASLPLVSVHSLLKILFSSVFFVIITTYLAIFGGWQVISDFLSATFENFSLPRMMFQSTFNPATGSAEGLAIFLAIISVFLTSLILLNRKTKDNPKPSNLFYKVLLFAGLGLLLIIDFTAAWLILVLSLGFFIVFVLQNKILNKNADKLFLPICIIIIAIAGFFTNNQQLANNGLSFINDKLSISTDKQLIVNRFSLPYEQTLSCPISFQIASNAVSENVKSHFLGSGIGTFHYEFSKFRPREFNQNVFWQLRFDRSGSHIAEVIGTVGGLGALAYFGLIATFLLMFFGKKRKHESLIIKKLLTGKDEKPLINNKSLLVGNNLSLVLVVVFIAIIVGQFIYYQNMVLALMFWLILAIGMVVWRGEKSSKEIIFSFKDVSGFSFVFKVVLILLSLGIIGTYFQAVKFYMADVSVNRTATSAQMAISNLENAVRLNPFQSQYKVVLAKIYFNEALKEMNKFEKDQNQEVISSNISKAIFYIKGDASLLGAIEIAPNQVVAWETMGTIYRDIQGIASGATDWGVKAFERALELEPTNPVLYTELGKLYGNSLSDKEKAMQKFEKAIDLKPDYLDAHLQIVYSLDGKEDSAEAISYMEKLEKSHPHNIEILFQLGVLYFNDNQTENAIIKFKTVIQVVPNHSNALYSLAVAYQAQGKNDLALLYYEKVLELNLGNVDVLESIKNIKDLENLLE